MCKNARLNWLLACAGIAAAASAAAASDPVPAGVMAPPGQDTGLAADVSAMSARRVVENNNIYVDDMEALELANKLGLSTPANPEALRGLGTCPNIITDGFNCHVANLGLGANFSGLAAGSFRTMDNVTPASQNPDRICWIGRYANRVNPAVANESFQIRIFNSNPEGLPDLGAGPIFTRTFQQAGTAGNNLLELSCLDGETCPGTTQPAAGGHWVFSAQVTGGFPMNAFGCYWVEIANVGSNAAGVNWGWVGSQGGTDLQSLQAVDGNYTTFTRAENDRALCVSGGVDPLVGNCVLPPFPPICEYSGANGIEYDGVVNTGFFASIPPSVPAAGSGWNSFQIAENFAFDAATAVSGICFQGFWQGYQSGAPVAVAIPADPQFRVIYFGNVGATGVPGAPLPMASFQTGQPGVNLIWDNDGNIRVEHPAVNFAADSCFWVSIGRVHNQPNPAQPIPVFHWLATGGTQVYADDRAAFRTANTAAGGAWNPLAQAIEGTIQNCNVNFLLSSGPVAQQACSAPPCNIAAGGVAEGEANCGLPNDTINGGCNSATPVFSTLTCGQTRRGTVAFNGETRDLDWYQFTLAGTMTANITVNSEFPGFVGFVANDAGPMPAPLNCADPGLAVFPFADVGSCTPVTLSRTLGPGTWTVIVAPNFGDQLPCANTNGTEYTIALACVPPASCSIPAGGTAEGEANCGLPNDNSNGGCVSDPFVVDTVTCGSTIRGSAAWDGQFRDTDWYQVTLAQPGNITLTLNAEFDAVVGFVGDTAGPLPAPIDCANPDLQVFGAILGGDCTPVTLTQAVGAGTWTIFVAPDFDGDVVACSPTGAGNEYTLLVECGGGTPTDCNQNGTDDAQEIAGNPALDCWNAASPVGVTGGADGALDVCQCTGNFNRDGAVNSSDISSFLTGWLASVQAGNTNGDINCSGATNSSDISSFLTVWLANVNGSSPFDGCP